MATGLASEGISDTLPQTKPPFLRNVRIRGYKSIAFCDVTLEPLTVIVGRNSAGKSNFLDALGFLSDLMDLHAFGAVHNRGGWRAIQSRTGRTPHIEIGIRATFDGFKCTWDADYSFCLEIAGRNPVRVQREELTLRQHGRDRRLGYRIDDGNVVWFGLEHFKRAADGVESETNQPAANDKLDDPMLFRRVSHERLLLSAIGTNPFNYFADLLRASCVYNFSPAAIREHQPMTSSPLLARDGANLARAIEGLREIEPETISRIEQYLRVIVPNVVRFHTQEYGDFETVRFGIERGAGQPSLEFDASSVSEGTLRVLAALVAAFQLNLPVGFPGFVAIEDPEAALHPAAIQALVDALDEATLRTQILLATHSTELLDNPTVRPESVRVAKMINGQTVIAPIDQASLEIARRQLNTIGGLERDNLLEPDLDDIVRQRELAFPGEVPEA
jgi:predicted ATPase